MIKYVARRMLGMAAVLAIVAVLVFLITRLAPGDPAAVMLGDQATPDDIAHLRAVYGLDKPIVTQFFLWLREVLHGNLGQSIK